MIRKVLASLFFSDIVVDFEELKDRLAKLLIENIRLERIAEAKDRQLMQQANEIGKLQAEKRTHLALIALHDGGNK